MAENESIGGVKEISVAAPKTSTGVDENGKKIGYRELSVSFNYGETLEEACEMVGEDVVFSSYISSGNIDAQNFIRTRLEAKNEDGSYTHTDEAIVAAFAGWKPGVKTRERVTPMDKIKKLLAGLSDSQKEALLNSMV
jgi:hypothetical protein